MILTVTLNPALDITYRVDSVVPHATHRVRQVAERPGGKGVNVANLVHRLGEPVTATGLIGGHTGERVTDLLAAEGVPADFVAIAGETRRTVVVHDGGASGGTATGFWEPGPTVTPAEWERFTARFRDLVSTADVVTVSGSLPSGVPVDAYATLVRIAREAGVPVILDADGEPLRHGLAAGPSIVKPNAEELAAAIGHPPSDPDEARSAAQRLHQTSGATIVASLGPDGLIAVTEAGQWRAVPPPQAGNPTGAGDAVVAMLARGLRLGTPWPERLADAAAFSAAAVLAPVAGVVELDAYRRIRTDVTIKEMP